MEVAAAPASRRLSAAQLAYEASAPEMLITELAHAALIVPDAAGTYHAREVAKVRLAHALTSGGISVDDILHEIGTGHMPFPEVPSMGRAPGATGRTFAEFAATLGERGEQLQEIYSAFGLGVPPPETAMFHDEEAAVTAFLEVWSMVDARPELLVRAARIVGEGIRHVVVASLDLFDEFGGSPPQRIRRGLTVDEAVEPSVRQAGMMNLMLPWLRERHMEHEVFSRIIAFTEASLARAGRIPTQPDDPPAIAFVDLTGYTERTAQAGDELAARDAATLQAVAQVAANAHGGRVVKLLGDGVMLRFASARAAVAGVRDLMAAIRRHGLPPAHAGIAAGPVVVRDGDVYGHTVNLASRISGQSSAGEVLVPADIASRLAGDGIRSEEAGEVRLKGIANPIRLARVIL
jgi:adenylate cyclase